MRIDLRGTLRSEELPPKVLPAAEPNEERRVSRVVIGTTHVELNATLIQACPRLTFLKDAGTRSRTRTLDVQTVERPRPFGITDKTLCHRPLLLTSPKLVLNKS
uniref:Uncharacterized protein n=1 Tax=Steinernema glaseri TaxID=37863 RepID=A0A1I8A4J1_9BILA